MAETAEHLERVQLAARLYYVDGLAQAEIARILEVSQAMVSRFLQAARDRGIVRITVEEYQPRDVALEAELRAAYPSLGRLVAVVRDPIEVSDAGIRRNVGYFAAPIVSDLLRPADVVGLTGGRTIAELIARARAPRPIRDVRVVPLMGSIGAAVNASDAAELSRALADEFGGSCYALNTPAFASTPASQAALLAQDQVRAVWGLYGQMTVAIVGIGTLRESAFIERGILTDADLERLARAGAVGEVCCRYYDADGRECPTDYRKRVVSIELEELRRVPEVVAVTAGEGRAAAAAVAIRAGLVKSLIVDERCARALVAHARRRPRDRAPQ